jgi:hypothetical protein
MEREVLRALVANPTVLPRLARHVRAEGFSEEVVQLGVRAALAYHAKTGRAPTAVALLQEVREGTNRGQYPEARVREVAEAIDAAADEPAADGDWVVSKILAAERSRAAWRAVDRAYKLLGEGKIDEMEEEVVRACAVGRVDHVPGQDYVSTLDRRTEERIARKAPRRWGTGIPDLDDLIGGGLSRDNPLGMVIAGPKAGKSMLLSQVSRHHMGLGGFAVYFSFENGEAEIVARMDASIALVPVDEIYARADEVRDKVEAWSARAGGGFHVKKFPGGHKTSCRDLDVYLEELRARTSARPTCLVFDYLANMRCDEQGRYDRRHEELEAIAGEMRALLDKWDCVGWTGGRVKAEALEKGDVDLSDTGGALALANEVDLMVAILRSEEEERDEQVRFKVVASRYSRGREKTGRLHSAYGVGRIVAATSEGGGPG